MLNITSPALLMLPVNAPAMFERNNLTGLSKTFCSGLGFVQVTEERHSDALKCSGGIQTGHRWRRSSGCLCLFNKESTIPCGSEALLLRQIRDLRRSHG